MPKLKLPPPKRQNLNNILSPELTPEDDARLVKMYLDDPKLFIEGNLFIRSMDPAQGVIPFVLNIEQQVVLDIIQDLRRQGKPVRLIVDKARKVGISTLIQALMFMFLRLQKNVTGMIIAHDADTSKVIYEMYKLFLSRLDPRLQPMVERFTTEGLTFGNPKKTQRTFNPGLNSNVDLATAKGKKEIRGGTIQYGHGTEAAYWDNPEATCMGFENAVPEEAETMLVFESTPNGMQGAFFRRFEDAVNGVTDWTAIFLSWLTHKEYIAGHGGIPALRPDELPSFEYDKLDDLERGIWDLCLTGVEIGIPGRGRKVTFTPDEIVKKLAWRRWWIANKCEGSVLRFQQDFGSTYQESFIAQGETVYDIEAIQWYLRKKEWVRPGIRGYLYLDGRGKPNFAEHPQGNLVVWKFPSKDRDEDYVVGADAAMGTQQDAQRIEARRRKEIDASAACVMSWSREQQCELFDDSIGPEDFAALLWLLGYWYTGVGGPALILVECEPTSSGNATLAKLKDSSYPRLGMRQGHTDRSHDPKKQYGFRSTGYTKSIMEGKIARELRRGAGRLAPELMGLNDRNWPPCIIHSEPLLIELSTYRIWGGSQGKHGAKKGKGDDRVTAYGLSLLALDQIPVPPDIADSNETWRAIREMGLEGRPQRNPWQQRERQSGGGDFPEGYGFMGED